MPELGLDFIELKLRHASRQPWIDFLQGRGKTDYLGTCMGSVGLLVQLQPILVRGRSPYIGLDPTTVRDNFIHVLQLLVAPAPEPIRRTAGPISNIAIESTTSVFISLPKWVPGQARHDEFSGN
jgi:hypothetical protein